jgi:transcription factor TFIIIB component B''
MTSRVRKRTSSHFFQYFSLTFTEKGGPIFRPVAKSRTRPPAGDNRQPSVPVDGPSDSRHDATSTSSRDSMPPPVIVPNRATPVPPPSEPFDEATTQQALNVLYASHVPQPSSDPLAPSLLSGPPPALVNSQATPHLASNRNGTPAPPTIVSHAPPALISTGAAPPILSFSLPTVAMSPSPAPGMPGNNGPTNSPSYPHVLHHSGVENVPRLALNTGVVIKPQRTASKKNSRPIARSGEQQEDPNHVEKREGPPEKKTKRRKTSQEDGSEPVKTQPKRKKRNVVTSDPEDSGNDATETPANKRKQRSSSGTPRPRRSQAPSLPPFDPDADPGEEIDPTVVTMASLCVDTGQGRVSRKAAEILSNHAAWKAQNREKRARMKALMELKKYGREEDGGDGNTNETSPVDKEAQDAPIPGSSNGVAPQASTPVVDDTGSGFDYSQGLATSRFNVQVRIGPNGETIIDEESLVVDRTEADDTENYTHVVESDHTKFVNSGSYGKKYRGSRWSAEETESFYDVRTYLVFPLQRLTSSSGSFPVW